MSEIICWHKQIGVDGICLDCGKRAAISLNATPPVFSVVACPFCPQKDAQIAALTAERDALAAREKAYLSELADYGKTVERLRAQVTRLQADSTAELLKHREQREAMAKHIQELQDNLDAFLAQREMERNRKEARDAE